MAARSILAVLCSTRKQLDCPSAKRLRNSKENFEKIFDKFSQVDGSITKEKSGAGLGLAISKDLADLLAANIGLESEVGKGSTFWLDLPVSLNRNTMSSTETKN